jgi:hypothetical protein
MARTVGLSEGRVLSLLGHGTVVKNGHIMTKIFKSLILTVAVGLCGCSQEEHVVLINRSGSGSVFAISADNVRTRIGPELDLFSRQILRYQRDILIKLEMDGVIYNYEKNVLLRSLWKHRASRDEMILLLARNKSIYVCDPNTRRPLEAQPEGFPLVPIK